MRSIAKVVTPPKRRGRPVPCVPNEPSQAVPRSKVCQQGSAAPQGGIPRVRSPVLPILAAASRSNAIGAGVRAACPLRKDCILPKIPSVAQDMYPELGGKSAGCSRAMRPWGLRPFVLGKLAERWQDGGQRLAAHRRCPFPRLLATCRRLCFAPNFARGAATALACH